MTNTAPAWSVRKPMIYGFVTLVALVGGFGGWSVATKITGAIVTSGQIEVEQNRQVVQHPDGGVVATINVAEGDTVAAGDLILSLDGAGIRSELAIVEGQFFETLARRGRLEAERDDRTEITFNTDLTKAAKDQTEVAEKIEGQIRLFEARKASLDSQTEQLAKQREQIEEQIGGFDAQNQALKTQLELLLQELADQQGLLEKGLTQASQVLGLQREEARLRGQMGELAATRAQAQGRITETQIEVLRLSSDRREEANSQLRESGAQELELAERRRALVERISRLDVRAPVSGIVLGLTVTTPRAVLRPADPVLYLIPQDRPLVIATRVPPIHVDQVHVGQSVKLVFSAFSSRETPELTGHVAVVSADALIDQRTQMPYYRAEILLDDGEMAKLSGQTLIPGMPVEAFIQTEARTPLAYLLKPFTDYFARAFRES
jgi:HlyD family secretion protein